MANHRKDRLLLSTVLAGTILMVIFVANGRTWNSPEKADSKADGALAVRDPAVGTRLEKSSKSLNRLSAAVEEGFDFSGSNRQEEFVRARKLFAELGFWDCAELLKSIDDENAKRILSGILAQRLLASGDKETAIAILIELKGTENLPMFYNELSGFRGLDFSDLEEIAKQLERNDFNYRDHFFEGFVGRISDSPPEAAVAQTRRISEMSGVPVDQLYYSLAARAVRDGDAWQFLSYLSSDGVISEMNDTLLGITFSQLLKNDSRGVGEWLASNGDVLAVRELFPEYVQSLSPQNPEALAEWIEAIEDPEARQAAMDLVSPVGR